MQRTLLIAGIDPGTTTAYALLDLDKRLIALGSVRHLSFDELINIATACGRVVIVGSDKAKSPGLVERFATKLGARVVLPQHDLLVRDKRVATARYNTANSHETDALAAALIGYQTIGPLLKNARMYLSKVRKPERFEQVIEHVFTHEETNIRDALAALEEPIHSTTPVIQNENLAGGEATEEQKLRSIIRRLHHENILLRAQNREFLEKSEQAGRRAEFLEQTRAPLARGKARHLLDLREHIIIDKQKRIDALAEQARTLNRFLANVSVKVLAKRICTLRYDELLAADKRVSIREGDVLLVYDPSRYSDKSAELLNGKVQIIIHEKPVSKDVTRKFAAQFIDASRLVIEMTEHFALVERASLERERAKATMISRIVEGYRADRKRFIK